MFVAIHAYCYCYSCHLVTCGTPGGCVRAQFCLVTSRSMCLIAIKYFDPPAAFADLYTTWCRQCSSSCCSMHAFVSAFRLTINARTLLLLNAWMCASPVSPNAQVCSGQVKLGQAQSGNIRPSSYLTNFLAGRPREPDTQDVRKSVVQWLTLWHERVHSLAPPLHML